MTRRRWTHQLEAGVKAELLNRRLPATAAVFTITKRDVLRPDPALGPSGTNANAVLSTGKARSRGLELDLTGQLAPWWNLSVNYAYIRTRILDDLNPALVGMPLPNVAPHSLGLFSRTDFGRLGGIGVSLQALGDRVEPFAGIRAPGYAVVDLLYYQTVSRWATLRVKLKNVFDQQYAVSSLFATRAGNIPGQPRTLSIMLTLSSVPSRS
jgi:outer membrane receptor protein involved in Fe transport